MRHFVFVLVVAGCGSDSKSIDAKKDTATANTVQMTPCVGITPAATVTIASSGAAYMPATVAISTGQVVLFMTEASHDVSPGHVPSDTAITDGGLQVGFGQTACLKFTQAGTFGFHCSIHDFNGTITAQ